MYREYVRVQLVGKMALISTIERFLRTLLEECVSVIELKKTHFGHELHIQFELRLFFFKISNLKII